MRITKDLRLAFPLESEKNGTIHVYTQPIKRDTFELYFAELGAAFNACFRDGDPQHLALAGPRTAYAALKKAARADGTWDTPDGVENGLINEMKRLTTIAYATPEGWKQVPMATAQAHDILTEEDVFDILNPLVFFTAACKVGPPKLMGELLDVVAKSRGWETGFSTCTAYVDSLKPLKPDESSMPKGQLVTV